jgi:hypothetical protein
VSWWGRLLCAVWGHGPIVATNENKAPVYRAKAVCTRCGKSAEAHYLSPVFDTVDPAYDNEILSNLVHQCIREVTW